MARGDRINSPQYQSRWLAREKVVDWTSLLVLVAENLLTTLPPGHTLLLLLTGLCAGKLLSLLGADNLVAHGVELLLLLALVGLEAGTRALALHPVVAGRCHLSVNDSPDFLSQVLGELRRVSDDDDTTLELLERLGQGTKRVTVQVVGRLVEDDQVRTLPRAGGKDDLDTLTTGQTTHARVGNQLGIETEVGAVALNLLTDQRTELTRGKSFLHVDLGNHLLVGSEQLRTREPGVSERALVLVRVLELSAGVDADDAALGTLDLEDLVHGLLVLLSDDLVGTVHGLTVLTSLETPLNVLGRSLVQVVVDVGECVLLDVGDTDVLVLVDLTGSGDELTSQDVDQSRLAGTVGTNDGNTGAERALEGDVTDLGLGGTRVLEVHLGGTEDGLGLGLDTLEETGLGEGELDLGSAKLVVRLGRRALLDELLQVTTVTLKLEALVVNDVLADVVEEARVVRDDDGGARRVLEVLLEPLHVLHVQVVGGLVEQQNVGGLEHGTAQSQLHLPTTRQSGDLTRNHGVGETELVEALDDIVAGNRDLGLLQLLHGPVNGGHLSVGRVQVVLDEDGLDLALLGEALDLLIVDGAHESGLSGTVGTAKTVALATLETKVGLVEKNLGTVGERECAVAQVLSLLVVSLLLLSIGKTGGSLLAEGLDNALSLGIANNDADVRLKGSGPGSGINLLLVDELATNGGNVLDNRSELLSLGILLAGENVPDVGGDGGNVTVVAAFRDLAVNDVTDADKSVKTLLGLLTSLGVGHVLVVLLQVGHEPGKEGGDDVGVVDELAHVVDDDGRLTLDGSVTLLKTTLQERNHQGQGGLSDLRDEGGGTQQVDGLGDVLGLGDTLDELRNEALDIPVDNQAANVLHDLVGMLLNLLLGVPHGVANDGDEVGNTKGSLGGGGLDKSLDEVENSNLFRPLLGGDLVAGSGEHARQKDNQERLDVSRNIRVLSDGLDGAKSLLANRGILLVAELLLESLDGPEKSKRVSAKIH
ncbi:hypothetical protein PpBr36_04202 [Pyricularia pennisetigena]|uniref:hypothetical protein n=1 Tax=Pyricularia pennisetigena TaxID=1578925 RepID=UPI00114FE02A|nr:hypothetical protein PpBr36_04202 [Pyricularia pennisetigena]TLS26533.1 hypothetical protein PpBr36_04202 [Pyricularia pennisetigena]